MVDALVSPPRRAPLVRQQIHLRLNDARLARQLAERHADGNLSELFRQLIRAEAERLDLTLEPEEPGHVAA